MTSSEFIKACKDSGLIAAATYSQQPKMAKTVRDFMESLAEILGTAIKIVKGIPQEISLRDHRYLHTKTALELGQKVWQIRVKKEGFYHSFLLVFEGEAPTFNDGGLPVFAADFLSKKHSHKKYRYLCGDRRYDFNAVIKVIAGQMPPR